MADNLVDLADQSELRRSAPIEDTLARRARAWYLEAINHPLWKKYRLEADEDEGFYVGGEFQWSMDSSMEDLRALKQENRAVISVNHIQPIVNVLRGFERQNRFDIKAAPQGEEDDDDARLMTWLLKFVQEQADIPEHMSECFEDGVIRGLSALAVEIDWTNNVVDGEITAERLKPGRDCIWDPYWKKWDLSDCRYFIRYKWAWVPDLIAEYPDHAEAIRTSVSALQMRGLRTEAVTTDGSIPGGSSDGYGSTTLHPIEHLDLNRLFYDPEEQRALLLEIWYREYEPVWMVVDQETGHVEET